VRRRRPLQDGLVLFLLASGCASPGSAPVAGEGYLTGADGARIHYRTMGTGDETIVVVHGGPGAGIDSFLPSVEPLAETFHLILYDQRGGGRSELPADTDKLDARYFVEDLDAVRRYFGIERMNVIAQSFGAVLVARYAQRYPERLERVVFHGATGPRRSEAAKLQRDRAGSASSVDPALSDRASELLRRLLDGTASDPVAACREYEEVGRRIAVARGEAVHYRGTTCRAPSEAVRYYYHYTAQLAPRSFGDWDFTSGLEELSAPLLVVYGANDPQGIPAQREWADAVPDGRLLLVPEAGKAALSDNPSFVARALETFFRGEWPEGTGA
jgi:proline iminopeptidase